MKAVMYGAGNIGRGFIGVLFSHSGYKVIFIDIAKSVVEAIKRDKCYPVRIISGEEHEDITISNVDAIDGNDVEKVSEAIAEADIMATAVGVNVLKYIAPNIAAGLRKRFSRTDKPLDIIICENLVDANRYMERLLKELLTPEEGRLLDERIGLVEASIGRMVPVQTQEMQDGNPLRVCVEPYGFLPVDEDAFKGEIPKIENLVPFTPFNFHINRKLYIHNMGHSTCAYLGLYKDIEFIWESIADAEIRIIVQNAMIESALALSKEFTLDFENIYKHILDLISRFSNKALRDTCKRVGSDPRRKLSNTDRMIGSSLLCLKHGTVPSFIAIGAAGAVFELLKQENVVQSEGSALKVLKEVSGIHENNKLTEYIIYSYKLFVEGRTIADMRRAAETLRAGMLCGII